jgi:hypothetical protein
MSTRRNPVRLILAGNFTQVMIDGRDIGPWVNSYEIKHIVGKRPELVLHIPFVEIEQDHSEG